MEYRVQFEVDVEADSPEDAALSAWAQLTNPAAFPPMCDVLPTRQAKALPSWLDEGGQRVDLNELE